MKKEIFFVIVDLLKRIKQSPLSLCRVTISFFLLTLPYFAFAEEKIPVFPTTPVEAYTVYANLAFLWLGIIVLIIVIKMKLNEIKRIQALGIDREDTEAPTLS